MKYNLLILITLVSFKIIFASEQNNSGLNTPTARQLVNSTSSRTSSIQSPRPSESDLSSSNEKVRAETPLPTLDETFKTPKLYNPIIDNEAVQAYQEERKINLDKCKENANIIDDKGYSLLWWASYYGDLPNVKALLNCDAYPNLRQRMVTMINLKAIMTHNESVVNALLNFELGNALHAVVYGAKKHGDKKDYHDIANLLISFHAHTHEQDRNSGLIPCQLAKLHQLPYLPKILCYLKKKYKKDLRIQNDNFLFYKSPRHDIRRLIDENKLSKSIDLRLAQLKSPDSNLDII